MRSSFLILFSFISLTAFGQYGIYLTHNIPSVIVKKIDSLYPGAMGLRCYSKSDKKYTNYTAIFRYTLRNKNWQDEINIHFNNDKQSMETFNEDKTIICETVPRDIVKHFDSLCPNAKYVTWFENGLNRYHNYILAQWTYCPGIYLYLDKILNKKDTTLEYCATFYSSDTADFSLENEAGFDSHGRLVELNIYPSDGSIIKKINDYLIPRYSKNWDSTHRFCIVLTLDKKGRLVYGTEVNSDSWVKNQKYCVKSTYALFNMRGEFIKKCTSEE